MSVNEIEFSWIEKNQLNIEEFVVILKRFGDLLIDPMSQRVDLYEYAEKWLKYADILIAKDSELIVGIMVVYANDRETWNAHVLLISVLTSYQSRGIGRKLCNKAFTFAKNQGMTHVSLFVHRDNPNAINLYKSLGFKEIGRKLEKIEMLREL